MSDFDDINFDPSTVDDTPDLIPPGEYTAQVIEAENGVPRSGDGHMLKLTWSIDEGEHEGRRIWQSLCYDHSNKTTKDIAQKMLKRICAALDIGVLHEAEELKFKPARVRVSIEVDKTGQFSDRNKIANVKALNNGEATEANVQPAPRLGGNATAAPAAAGPGAAPWHKPAA